MSTLASIARLANDLYPTRDLSGRQLRRDGTVIHVVDEATRPDAPAAAWYEPTTGDIYIHLTQSGIVPLETGIETGKFAGLVTHESSHTLHSGWLAAAHCDLWKTEPALLNTMTMLEEVRIEKYAIDAQFDVRSHLRSSLDIIMKDLDLSTATAGSVAVAWILVVGRVAAGVAEFKEVEAVDVVARTILGDETVDLLSDLVQQATQVGGTPGGWQDDEIRTQMTEIAREINEMIPPTTTTGGGCTHGGETEGTPGSPSETTETGEGTGTAADPSDEESDEEDGASKADEDEPETEDEDETETETEISPGHGLSEDDADMIRRAIESVVEDITINPDRVTGLVLSDPATEAHNIFGRSATSVHTKKGWSTRPPTQKERQHVTSLARALEKLTIPAITKQPVSKQLPPGRLKTREAVRASAERAQGRMVTATPWRATKRQHSHVKPLVVGLMTDTSGSMRWAAGGMASAAYIVSNAGARIGARTASVTFGTRAHPVTWPREPAKVVVRKEADSGGENFDQAAAALDGALKLTSGEASKLVVIVTDGQLVMLDMPEKARMWCERWDAAGVQIIWIGASSKRVLKRLAPMAIDADFGEVGEFGRGAFIPAAIEAAIVKMAGRGAR